MIHVTHMDEFVTHNTSEMQRSRQGVAACYIVLQRVAACCSAHNTSEMQRSRQRVAACCSVLQRVAAHIIHLKCSARGLGRWAMNETYGSVMSHMGMSHVTHVTRMNESCHTYE